MTTPQNATNTTPTSRDRRTSVPVEEIIAKLVPIITSTITDGLQQIRREFKEDRQELKQDIALLNNKMDGLNTHYLSMQVADERNKNYEEFKTDMYERWQGYEDDKKDSSNRSFNVSQAVWLLIASVLLSGVISGIIFAIEKAIWH